MLRGRTIFDDFSNIFRSFDSLMRQMFETTSWPAARLLPAPAEVPALTSWTGTAFPAVEVYSRDDSLVFRAELPGVNPNEVEVQVADGRLVIRGEKKEHRRTEEDTVLVEEVFRGRFERSFALPEGVKADRVQATYEDGVLEIRVPVENLQKLTGRKVPIQIGAGKAQRAA